MENLKLNNGEVVAVGCLEDLYDVIREAAGPEVVECLQRHVGKEIEHANHVTAVARQESRGYELSLEDAHGAMFEAIEVVDELTQYLQGAQRVESGRIVTAVGSIRKVLNEVL